ncbi:MAG: hypothetical protein H6737_18955 [Alphaproteobacteria bacterium]|nr:hypothetical protein [Alphaproteobacteria bacterium]
MPRLLLLALAGCQSVQIGDDPVIDPVPTPPGCDSPANAPEGAFLEPGAPTSASLADCSAGLHAFAGAGTSTVSLSWSGPDATLQILDTNEAILQSDPVRDGDSVAFTLGWSGEHLVRVVPDAPDATDYALTATCTDGCDLLYTRYPLFFMHGMAGTDSFLDQLEYWYGVRGRLEPLGYAVYTGAVDPFQPSEVRAAQWAEQIDAIVATGQARRFNLIGHSQGGIDARYFVSVLDADHRAVSVTTISTPHRGTALLDIMGGLIDNPGITGLLVDQMFDAFIAIYDTENDQDILGQLDNLSADTMEAFNATVLDREDVYYASWAGKTCALLDVLCQIDNGGEIVTPMFGATQLGLALVEGENDGLVSIQSARWGEFLGTLPADHLDEVGLFPGTTAPGYDHLQFFENDAARLAALGY